MINNLLSIGLTSLTNAQVSVNEVSNNIANADTEGYRRTVSSYETQTTIDTGAITIGTGATLSILAQVDYFLEAAYLGASSDLSGISYAYDYLAAAETLMTQDEDSGLGALLSDFWAAWETLAADPTSDSAREALLGTTKTLIYEITATADGLDNVVATLEDEVQGQVDEANELIQGIAALNLSIVANQDSQELINERDLLIEQLAALVDVSVDYEENGMATVLTAGGYALVQDGVANTLVYTAARVQKSLLRASTYDGSLEFSGQSAEEILVDFVTAGADGTAQFRVSLDGGATWETDEAGNTLLYTADVEANSVEIEGVAIWFDGTGDHAVGDRYVITAKSTVCWSSNDGQTLINITPLSDEDTSQNDTRLSSGNIAGMLEARDGAINDMRQALDELAEALVWEVNLLHSQGAGTEHHTSLLGSYSVEDTTTALSNSGLVYEGNITAGDLSLVVYDNTGAVASNASITLTGAESLDDLALALNTAFPGMLTATVTTDNTLRITAATDYEFEIAGDETGVLAALGLNTFFSGSTSEDIALNATVTSDLSHVNCQVVEADGTVSSGSNDTATAIGSLADDTVTVAGADRSLAEHVALMVAAIGTAVSNAELAQVYAQGSVTYYQEQIASVSRVSVDEELVNLTKYQQMYEASAQIIATAQAMFETILDMT